MLRMANVVKQLRSVAYVVPYSQSAARMAFRPFLQSLCAQYAVFYDHFVPQRRAQRKRALLRDVGCDG